MNVLQAANLVAAIFVLVPGFALLLFMRSPRKRRYIFQNMVILNSVQLFFATCITIANTFARNPASAMAWGLILCTVIFGSDVLYEKRKDYQDYLETDPKILQFKDAMDTLIRNVGRRKPWNERKT